MLYQETRYQIVITDKLSLIIFLEHQSNGSGSELFWNENYKLLENQVPTSYFLRAVDEIFHKNGAN